MRNQLCYPCKECTLIDEHNIKVIKYYDILDVKRCCNVCERVVQVLCLRVWSKKENHERVERELLEQCGQVVTLVFRVTATMRRVHWVAWRTLLCQASASCRWTQIIRGDEDRTIHGCKVAIGATFRTHWRICEWQRKISRLARDRRHVWKPYIDRCSNKF